LLLQAHICERRKASYRFERPLASWLGLIPLRCLLDLLGVVEERDSKNALLFLVVGSGERESTVVSLLGDERTYIT
jgi:hypothetical protein